MYLVLCYVKHCVFSWLVCMCRRGYRGGGVLEVLKHPPPTKTKATYKLQWTLGCIAGFSTPFYPRKLDLTWIWLKYLFVEGKSRVFFSSVAVSLDCSIIAGKEGAWSKIFAHMRAITYPSTPLIQGPGSTPDVLSICIPPTVFSHCIIIMWTLCMMVCMRASCTCF